MTSDLVGNKTESHQLLAIVLLSLLMITSIPPTHVTVGTVGTPESFLLDVGNTLVQSDVVMGRVDYSIINTPDAFDGYNLFVLWEESLVEPEAGNVALIMDMAGNVVAQKQLGDIGSWHCPAEFIDPNTVLLGTTNGSALWHLETNTIEELGFAGSHEFEYNPNSDTVFTFSADPKSIDGIDYMFETIMEYDMTGTLVWAWNVSDFIPIEWWCPYNDTGGGYRDISHGNTIYYDADDDIIFYNSRNTNTFFKLNHTSKEVIWGLGEYGNFTLYDIQGNVCDELFYHAHSVEPIDENSFILFDNDMHNQTSEDNMISRMLEIRIDENTTKTIFVICLTMVYTS